MAWLLYPVNMYLTYYTFTYARLIWREGNKPGAIVTGVLAASFLPLTVIVMIVK